MSEARTENIASSLDKFQLQQPRALVLHAIRNPFSVGAVAAASPHLVSNVVSQVEDHHDVVVELGAGTGVITEALDNERQQRRGVVAIEIDPRMAEIAREKLSDDVEVIVGDAFELAMHFGEQAVDCVVCSLPLTLLSSRDLDALLTAARKVMKPDAVFVFYLYRIGLLTYRYQRVIKQVGRHFSSVTENRTIWRNFPPARVISCR
ncbi:MAG: methyltransferase domain-containing protein [Gammaproteobacteria bacterium]|nr:methyltransferase domain-containing protein [Gammaproteobacteria bacterium]